MVTAAVRHRAGRRMSLARWADLPDDIDGELVDGVLVEEEMPSALHELIVSWLTALLALWGDPRGAIVLGSGARYAVGRWRGRKPDLAVYLPGVPRPPEAGLIHVPPSIAVEVVSPSPRDQRRDRLDKVHEYARFGIRWYWILDPQLRSLEVLERGGDGRYVHVLGASGGQLKRVPGCRGLKLDLDALWARIDQVFPRAAPRQRRKLTSRPRR